MFSACQLSSDRENHPPEGAIFNEITQTPDAGLRHDEICHIHGRLTACGIPQCCEASSHCKRFERLAQNFATDLHSVRVWMSSFAFFPSRSPLPQRTDSYLLPGFTVFAESHKTAGFTRLG